MNNKIESNVEKKIERVVLVAVCRQNQDEEVMNALEELEELAKTAGAETVCKLVQNREHPHPATYVGKGKVEEIRETMAQLDATTVICDDELTPAQLKNLEEGLGAKVIDRTILILDIFAQHATTKEGALQVELAQHKYRMSRLTGLGASLSRLAGGIGTRGPGESKLESDKRHIRRRMEQLQESLADVKKHRDLIRAARKKQGKPLIAIVGYTNAGKSTLLNKLTQAEVLEADMLFATLDPTTRALVLPDGKEVILTDTVGFIRKLPHHLIEAFKSTLEEAAFADMLIHVVDASNPDAQRHMEVVHHTLKELHAGDKPMVTVFNKCDKPDVDRTLKDLDAFKTLFISVKSGEGLEDLAGIIAEKMRESAVLVKTVIPYKDGGKLQFIRQYGNMVEEIYRDDGIYIEAWLDDAMIAKLSLDA